MTDNQLYNYFKDRQHQFDEAPGDEVWGKIESGLRRKKFNPAKLLGIMALLAGAVYSTTLFLNTHDAIVPEAKIVPVNEPIYSPEIKEATRIVTERSTDTVKNKKVAKKENQNNGIKNVEHKNIILLTPVVTKNDAPDEKKEQAYKDSLPGKNKITTSPGKIRIQSLDQLTKAEYDSLVARAVRHYSDQPKIILIIVAEGHKPYRKLIETALRESTPQAYIRFMSIPADTIKTEKPVLKPIEFELKPKEETKKKIYSYRKS